MFGKVWLVFLLFAITSLQAVDHGNSTISESGTDPENVDISFSLFSPEVSTFLTKLLKERSVVPSAKASDDSSSNFATGIWGAFLFSLIGLAVFVAALIFLIRYVCEKRPAKARTTSAENLVPTAPRNNAIVPETRETHSFPPPTSTSFENRAMEFENSHSQPYQPETISNSAYSVQQYQYQPPTTSNSQPYSREISTIYGQQTSTTVSQDEFVFSRSAYEASSPPPATPGTSQTTVFPPPSYAYNSPPMSPSSPKPTPVYNQSKSVESEYNSEYYSEKVEEPFKYLDKYAPYTAQKAEVEEQASTGEMSTKRAVLRHSTPYKMIEERVQGEDYDDKDSFVPSPTSLNPTPATNKPPQLSSGSFNDGKSRLVRVLPRFHHVPSHNNPQQMGATPSMAVFHPVAPVPPPPPQSPPPIYAVPQYK